LVKKKVQPVSADLTPAELKRMFRELRYMSAENVAKDFRSPRERAAIAAIFAWISLNGCCAWELRRPGTYSTVAMSRNVRRDMGTIDAIVLPDKQYEHARAVLVEPKKPRKPWR
jgi:hypothetical protein